MLLRRRRREAERPQAAACSEVRRSVNSVSDGEPPPYDEAVRLPAPPMDSPPPDYDKVSELGRL